MPNTKHEREICDLVIGLRFKHDDETIENSLYPEDEVPPPPNAIDAVYKTNQNKYVVEHTTIESYPNQITEDHKVTQLLEIERSLASRISEKGCYHIMFDTETLKDHKISVELLEMLSNWAADKASTLEIGTPRTAPRHMVKETLQIKGRSIEVTLYRWPSTSVRVLVVRASPKDQASRLLSTMLVALRKKLEKLAKWKNDCNAYSVLILESIDIALASGNSIASALLAAIDDFLEKPDVIYIVQTHNADCQIWEISQPFTFDNLLFVGDYILRDQA